ncbi:MAG: M20/M25/M40 family metallo-hydrolase [Melioribacteraceae bacterium]|nr:M20/M25/M40 family metallo-hydrolase [Melioribacteraceae bacterium]MCF8352969.1 M20/M25/M40 family metallo-hydrolase [Melioribacteraceae bacterium]MCF8395352.1 M20/M25/M40 family metallo-hydrolase [Melioribacteraceae bacterium]MCF8417846.1 M20/M25/M40 family metallo-hydrolase [Melioribacteraceae bacterium]
MKNLLFIVSLFLLTNSTNAQNSILDDIKESVNIDTLNKFVNELSGEVNVIINGEEETISSRNKNSSSNELAEQYLYEKFEKYGYSPTKQVFSVTGTNVFTEKIGYSYPGQKYMICAHYDDMPSGSLAPGADDNASGTAAVLEAARILKDYDFPFTVVFALWDEEEQGLIGSDYYAQTASANGDTILGVLNIDMIGWDADNDGVCEIHTRDIADSDEIAAKLTELNTSLGIDLAPNLIDPGSTASDHSSFWDAGYSAVLLIENYYGGDFNNYYHTSNDLITHFNTNFFHRCSQLMISALANYALDLNIKIVHDSQIAIEHEDEHTMTADILTGLTLAQNESAPSLYYRLDTGSGFGDFQKVTGVKETLSSKYNFLMPANEFGTVMEYYFAVQDSASSVCVTLPAGGSGFDPPGSEPPENLFKSYFAQKSYLFADSADNMNNWTSDGTWDITNESFLTGTNSFTDSPNSDYASSADESMVSISKLRIPSCMAAFLEYDLKWSIENDYDYAQILLSDDNGLNWAPIEGKYTNPGTGSFQPYGEPLYDGIQTDWVHESHDITDLYNKRVSLKFLLKSDSYLNYDGIYIDNVKITILTAPPTSVDDKNKIANNYELMQNYPNPFNPVTTIGYSVAEKGMVTIKVFDVLGNEISTVMSDYKTPGKYSVQFDASNIPSGVYFYQMITAEFIDSKKLILVK